jgi:hypothetical protein
VVKCLSKLSAFGSRTSALKLGETAESGTDYFKLVQIVVGFGRFIRDARAMRPANVMGLRGPIIGPVVMRLGVGWS